MTAGWVDYHPRVQHPQEAADLTARWSRRQLTPFEQQRERYRLGKWRSGRAMLWGGGSATSCMLPKDDVVNVDIGYGGSNFISGVMRCGSVWSCPVCSPRVRSHRARDVEAAVEAAHALGLDVFMVTGTVPHTRADRLVDVLDRVQGMWSEAWGGKAGKGVRDRSGVLGSVRALEVTYGANGWHAHIHGLFFAETGKFRAMSFVNRWRSRFEAHGIGEQWVPHVSMDVRRITAHRSGSSMASGGTTVAAYLSKVNMEWGAGLELARADLKTRGGLNTAAMMELAAAGEAQWVHRWVEWERTISGRGGSAHQVGNGACYCSGCAHHKRRFALRWSPGLRALATFWQLAAIMEGHQLRGVSLGGDELTDVDAAAGQLEGEILARWEVTAATWRKWRGAGQLGRLLQLLVMGREVPTGCRLVERFPSVDGDVLDAPLRAPPVMVQPDWTSMARSASSAGLA